MPDGPLSALEQILADPALQYRFLVEESSDVLAIHAPEGRLRWISPSIQRMLGWTAEERLSGQSGSMIHPDDLPAVLAVNRQLHEGLDSGSTRIRLLHKDGREIWAVSTARAWRDESGDIAALVVVTHDIDDVVRAEEERRRVETLYQLLAENANDVVLETVDGIIRWVSPSVSAVLGWDPEQLVGEPAWEYMHPDDLRPVQDDAVRVHAGLSMTGRARARMSDGTYRWMARTQRPVLGPDGMVVSHVTGLRDVHEQVRAELARLESEAHYRQLAESAAHFTVRVDADHVITWVSPSVERTLGWTPDELIGTPAIGYLHPEHHETAAEGRAVLREGTPLTGRGRVRRKDGSYVWLSQTATPVVDADGSYDGHVSGYQDVDAMVRAELELVASEARFRLAMDAAPSGMAVTDLDRRFVSVNPALCRMLGRTAEWLLQHRIPDVIHPDDDDANIAMRTELLAGADHIDTVEVRLRRADGSDLWAQHGLALLRDAEGRPTGFVSQLVDVSEARAVREELRILATHDLLTGLLNRGALLDHLRRVLAHPARAGLPTAVLYFDVDGLKALNDTLGHAAGDDLISHVATHAREALRTDDVLARIGGDEFVAVLAGISTMADALHVADKLHTAVGAPLVVRGREVRPTMSVGAALSTPGISAEDLLDEADQAMLAAKRSGGHGTAAHDPRG